MTGDGAGPPLPGRWTGVLLAVVVLAAVPLAGCTGPGGGPYGGDGAGGDGAGTDGAADGDDGPRTFFTHTWFYGPNSYDPDAGNPVFRSAFDVEDPPANVTVEVEWKLTEGHAAVNLTRPDGSTANVTSLDKGADDRSVEQVPTRDPDGGSGEGGWSVRIVTWRDEDGAFPEGRIDALVTGP